YTGGFGWSRNAAVERVHDANDNEEERKDLRDRLEFFFPRITKIDRMRTKPALPDYEQGPQYKEAGEHEARQHTGDEQAPNRRFSRDAIQDERDRWRDTYAECSPGADRTCGNVVRITAPPHFRNAHLSDGRAASGRRSR